MTAQTALNRNQPRSGDDEAMAVNCSIMARPWCDGGGGALGHPRVYLSYSGKGQTECPYCGKRFVTLLPEKH